MLLDERLQSFVAATTEDQTQHGLTQLMLEQAEPIIKEIVGFRLRAFARINSSASESEDVCSEVRLQLLRRLHELKENPAQHNIRDFHGYVAVTTYRACAAYLRRKYPNRFHLKHKLRFLLSQRAEFATWESSAENLVAGFAKWSESQSPASEQSLQRLRQLHDDPEIFVQASLPRGSVANLHLAEIVAAIFAWVEAPVELDELTGIVAAICGVRDHVVITESSGDEENSILARLPEGRADVSQTLEHRAYLEQLWEEIKKMSARHCAALLLNLKDERGQSATELFVFTGVVSFRTLAQAMGLSEMEFAQIWNQLPLDDLTIAAQLGLTRQQVINLRKTARERLARFINSLATK